MESESCAQHPTNERHVSVQRGVGHALWQGGGAIDHVLSEVVNEPPVWFLCAIFLQLGATQILLLVCQKFFAFVLCKTLINVDLHCSGVTHPFTFHDVCEHSSEKTMAVHWIIHRGETASTV